MANKPKKYKLLQDLPDADAGDIYVLTTLTGFQPIEIKLPLSKALGTTTIPAVLGTYELYANTKHLKTGEINAYDKNTVENNPKWFALIKDKGKPMGGKNRNK